MKSNKLPSILIFTDWYLPGYKAGGPISSLSNLVDAFGDQFEFKIVCGDCDYTDTLPYSNIESDKWNRIGNADVLYLSEAMRNYQCINRLIRDEKPDSVYINGLFSKVFSIFPLRAARRHHRRIVLAPRGMLAPGALGIKARKKRIFLSVAKAIGMYKKVVFHATNAQEVAQIRKAITGAVDVVEVANVPKLQLHRESSIKNKGYLRILILARIAREKNIEYALRCLTRLSTHLQVEVDIVGPVYDQDYFESCKLAQLEVPANVRIFWHGAKSPREILPYFERAHLFFLPTLGENFGHAILESLLSGVPVLVSDQTPWRNLEQQGFGKEIALSDMKDFVEFITEIAEMSAGGYANRYADLGQKAMGLVDMLELEEGYKKLFG